MVLEGIIEEIIYRNSENGYTVALLNVNDKNLVSCVGKFGVINIGEYVRLEGEWTKDKRYGEQFSFSKAETILPKSTAGIEKYLASGLIPGVGEVTAHNIVKMFGKETFAVIELAPEKLADVARISLKKALEIGEKFKELREMQNAIMFLQEYNITTNLALKIYNTYGPKTLDIVKKNPYKLVEDVDGIGFLSADKIAGNMGIKNNSEFRIRAGILHTLNTSSERNGHTFLPTANLMSELTELLELDPETNENIINDTIENLKLDKVVMQANVKGLEITMLSKFFFIESSIAQKLCLLNSSALTLEKNFEQDVKAFEEINNIRFHSDQKDAVISAVTNGVSVITGGPGTGKTTIVKCIITILKQQGMNVLLLAPTGRAAKRMSDSTGEEAKTIHRALEVNFKGNFKSGFNYNENNPLNTDAVIVDEVSMVDASLMNYLLKALPRDAKLILVGDKDQLPSVGAGNVLDDILKSEIIKTIMLTKIFRQEATSLIITNAHLINEGKMPVIDNQSKDFFFESKVELPEIKNSIVNMVVERIPSFANTNSENIQVLAPLKAGVCGIDNLNTELQKKLNPPAVRKHELNVGSTIFRTGDKVMQTVNNYELTWVRESGYLKEVGEGVFNGDIGHIEDIDFQTNEVSVEFEDGRLAVYPRNELSQLSLAYAITIHKSQGSEFDYVIIPAISGPSIILHRNLIYTAVTRAKKMVVIVGEQKNLRRMISNVYTIKRYTLLRTLLLDSDKKMKEMFE